MTMRKLSLTLAAAALAACGPKAGKADPNATKVQAGDLEPPSCEGNELKLRYPKAWMPAALADDPVDAARGAQDYAESRFEIGPLEISSNSVDGGHLYLEAKDKKAKMVIAYMQTNIKDGDVVAARGYARTDALDVGNCENPPVYVSKLSWIKVFGNAGDPQAASFVLRQLKKSDYCKGEDVAGTVSGCFSYAQ